MVNLKLLPDWFFKYNTISKVNWFDYKSLTPGHIDCNCFKFEKTIFERKYQISDFFNKNTINFIYPPGAGGEVISFVVSKHSNNVTSLPGKGCYHLNKYRTVSSLNPIFTWNSSCLNEQYNLYHTEYKSRNILLHMMWYEREVLKLCSKQLILHFYCSSPKAAEYFTLLGLLKTTKYITYDEIPRYIIQKHNITNDTWLHQIQNQQYTLEKYATKTYNQLLNKIKSKHIIPIDISSLMYDSKDFLLKLQSYDIDLNIVDAIVDLNNWIKANQNLIKVS